MIKVIGKEETLTTACDGCDSYLTYDKEDVTIGLYGREGFKCPVCGKFVFLGDRKAMPKFPSTFYRFGQDTDAVEISDEEANSMVQKVLEDLNYMREDFSFFAVGNTVVIGFKNNEGLTVWVAKNYWEDSMPLEDFEALR